MKIGIIGSRGFENEELIRNKIDHVLAPLEEQCLLLVFLGGGSKGAERIAADHVTGNLQYDYVLFKPYNFIDTKVPHDPKYFYFRNKQIVDNADVLIVFDDEQERNLAKTIHYIKNATKKDYHIFYLDGTSNHRHTEKRDAHSEKDKEVEAL